MKTKTAKSILVIDDEELLTRTFTLLLERNGYQVYVAKNGQDAQVMAEEEPFDLIISDIRMPGPDGVETVKAIRASAEGHRRSTPVIFITGYADEKTEQQAKQLQPVAYLFKPFDNAELLGLVQKCLT